MSVCLSTSVRVLEYVLTSRYRLKKDSVSVLSVSLQLSSIIEGVNLEHLEC